MRLIIFLIYFSISFSIHAQYDIDALYRKGLNNLNKNDLEKAISTFNTISIQNPDSWEAFLLKGISKFYIGDHYGGIVDLTESIKLNPYVSDIFKYRGLCYMEIGDEEKALYDFKKGISLDPANPQLYCIMGRTMIFKENFDSALYYLNKALDVSPQNSEAFLNRGLCYAWMNDFENAESDFSKAYIKQKFNAQYYFFKGSMYFNMEKYDKASEELSIAIKLDTENALYYYFRAFSEAYQNNYNKSISDFSKVLKLNPLNTQTLFYRALLYYELGKLDSSLLDFSEILEIDSKNVLIYLNRADLYNTIGQNDLAINDIKKALEILPDDIFLLYQLASLYQLDERYNDAIKCLSRAIDVNSNFYDAYILRAELYLKMNKTILANGDLFAADRIKKDKKIEFKYDDRRIIKFSELNVDFVRKSDYEVALRKKLSNNKFNLDLAKIYEIKNECTTISDKRLYSIFIDQLNQSFKSNFEFSNMHTCDSVENELIIYDSTSNFELFNSAIQFSIRKDFKTATHLLNKIINQDSTNFYAYFTRACVKYNEIDLIKSFDNEVSNFSLNSSYIKNSINITNTNKIYTDYFNCEKDFTKVIENEPEFYYAWYNRANVRMQLHEFDKAIDDYSKSIEIEKDFGDAYFNRALAYLKISDTTSACIDFGKAGELGEKNVYPLIRTICK